MKKYFTLILVLMVSWSVSQAQNSFSGKIMDDQDKPIFFATIALYNQVDNSVVSSASSDENGAFELSGIKDGAYYLEATMLGYKNEVISELKFPKEHNKAINFTLATDALLLSTIEIKERRPLLEQQADRLVVNVAENITSLNSNLLEVMKKVPGVIIVGEQMKLAGSTTPTILINGKTTKYMDVSALLKDMPGDNVQKVEIIHQPGAEFDASGTGPIINIILKKNSLFGSNGTVRIGVSKGDTWRYRTGISLSHYQGSVNINGSFGYRNSNYESSLHLNRFVLNDQYDQLSQDFDKSRNYRGNLSLDWDIDERHRVGFQSRYTDHMSDDLTVNQTDITLAATPEDVYRIRTENKKDSYWKFASINPYYTFEIDTTGQKLEADFNYIEFWNDGENILTPVALNSGEALEKQKYNQPGKTKIIVGKLDYTYPLSKAFKMQIGAKYSLADLDNNFQSFYDNNKGWKENLNESNHYLFDETTKAAYAKLSFDQSKWSGTIGLRYEDSDSNGESIGFDTTLNRRIKKLFPSLSLSREIIAGLRGTVSYSYRIERPQYSSLNPFRYQLDSYTSERGNPSLRPELTHSSKFSLSYDNQPFFNLEYKVSNDAMVDVIEQDDETGIAFKTTVNLESKKGLNMSLFFPLSFIPKISGYAGVIANRIMYDSKYLNEVFDRSKWDYTGVINVNYTLPWDINTEVSGFYTSGGLEGLIDGQWMYGIDFGFSKRFLNEKAKISIGVNNIFSRFFHGEVNFSNIDMDILNTWESPVVNMQFSYKFGNQHYKKSNKHKSSASDELNRVGK